MEEKRLAGTEFSEAMGRLLAKPAPSLMYVHPRAYREIQWYWDGLPKWAGSNWRRIKREHRRFIDARKAAS